MKIGKTDIRTDTFFKKGVKVNNEFFQNILIVGRMGSGKTYFSVLYTLDLLKKHKFNSIKTNIHSLKIDGELIEYFDELEEIYNDFDDNCIYIIDELGKRYTRESRQDNNFYGWLQQSRKCHRFVICIHQTFKLVPPWLREPFNYVYTTHRIPFSKFFKTTKGDAENMILDENKEWTCPVIGTIIYKRTKDICSHYDTLERVLKL